MLYSCSIQGHDETYNPENSDALEENVTVHDGVKDCKFMVFESTIDGIIS